MRDLSRRTRRRSNRNNKRRQLKCETLESRQLLAGDGFGTEPIYGVNVTSDIVYRDDAEVGFGTPGGVTTIDLELDLYEPVGTDLPDELPAAILIHGGGFTGGSKSQGNFVSLANDFASRGYLTVSINYRLVGDNVPPAPPNPPLSDLDPRYDTVVAAIEDTFHAIEWLKASADGLGVDAERIVLGGHSAGGFLSSFGGMLDVPDVQQFDLDIDISDLDVAAVLDGAGSLVGFESTIDSADPPTFILHSSDDGTVPYGSAVAIANGLTAANVPFEFPEITSAGHGLAPKLNTVIEGETVRDQMFDFFEEQLDLAGLFPNVLGSVNRGIGVDDGATGTGWIMHSGESVFTRFAAAPPNSFNSDQLVAVRYNSGQWQYNDNQQWRNFSPRTDDVLLASVDFSGDTIVSLEGQSGQVNGITQGFSSGDLTFFADLWNGAANDGEFTIEGTSFVASEAETTTRPLGPVVRGIGVDDDAVGTGWIMHSVESVFTRFATAPPNSQNSDQLIAVRYDTGQWQYNDNQQWRSFTPSPDDLLVASVDFDADTINSLAGQSGLTNGVNVGYAFGDLTFLADRWNGAFNDGEFTIEGTSFVINTLEGTDRSLGPVNRGIGVEDAATGTGWIMHSVESVFTRFAAAPPNSFNSDHLVAVRNEAGQWQYNDNQQWRDFVPADGDVLLASVDFSADTVTSLQGQSGLIQGIEQGFLYGDLTFIADRWNGSANDGEFTVTGTVFRV